MSSGGIPDLTEIALPFFGGRRYGPRPPSNAARERRRAILRRPNQGRSGGMRRNRVWALWAIGLALAPLAGCASLTPREATPATHSARKPGAGTGDDADGVRVCVAMATTLENAGDDQEARRLY